MANEETNKFSSSSTLKVPPLKIVLSVHQNNTVVNVEESLKSNVRDDNSNDHTDQQHESGRRNGSIDVATDSNSGAVVTTTTSTTGDTTTTTTTTSKQHRKKSKSSTERSNDNNSNNTNTNNNESSQLSTTRTTVYSSSSSSNLSLDRSNSTTPSSESESLASNSTIISELPNNQQQTKTKGGIEAKEETTATSGGSGGSNSSKQEILSRIGTKGTTSEKYSDKSSSNKRVVSESNVDHQSGDSTTSSSTNTCSKEQSLNQRITRSSQRAAQQNKMETTGENGEEQNVAESHEKVLESVRKVKRRKGEVQESEQDGSQSGQQLTVAMANIYPADYQMPSQNSFELYRDIRKRPYKKLMKLSHIQPKVPHFKDYLINGGPYLLDGNKLGVGLSGSRVDNTNSMGVSVNKFGTTHQASSSRPSTLKMKYTTQQKKASLNRHTSYTIPMISVTPMALQPGSPLYELFQDQEKARHKMRMQHLKERERAIMAAEQEILRAYNKAAIADRRQKHTLSACTYFYYQERYHYIDEKSGTNGNAKSKEVPHSQDNSFLCIEGGESTTKTALDHCDATNSAKSSVNDHAKKGEGERGSKDEMIATKKVSAISSESESKTDQDCNKQQVATKDASASMDKVEESTITSSERNNNNNKTKTVPKSVQPDTNGSKQQTSTGSCASDNVMTSTKTKDSTDESSKGELVIESNNINDEQVKKADLVSHHNNGVSVEELSADATKAADLKEEEAAEAISDEDLKILNKEVFITQLQDIDDKWDKIKRDMWVRHKNEADSLYAVQTLEWEWKAKEIGVCDVRVSLKVEPEFVPRVDVAALDY